MTRNIALSNASHCAQPQGLASNANLLDISGVGGTTIFTDIVLFALGAGSLVGDYFDDTATFLLGFLPGSTKIDIEFKANAFPSTGTAQIYKGRLKYTKSLLWVVPITRTIFNTTENSLSSDLFVDNFPGGVNPFGLALEDGDLESNFFFGYGYNLNLNLGLNFISVTSALDVGSGNSTLSESDYFRTYTSSNPPTGTKSIPFDNFTTSFNLNNSFNEPHITFNKRNGDWLAEELDADTVIDYFDCTAFCSNAELIGDDYLCTTGTYAVTTAATFTNWTVDDPNNLVSFLINANEITLTQLNQNQNGIITVTASYGNPKCGYTTVIKEVRVGTPDFYNTFDMADVYDNMSINDHSNASIPVVNGADHYKWRIDVVNNDCTYIDPNTGLLIPMPPNKRLPKFTNTNSTNYTSLSPYASIDWGNCSGNYQVRCYAQNNCGQNLMAHEFVAIYDPNDHQDDPCDNGWFLKSYPNPIKDGTIIINRYPPGNPCDNIEPFGRKAESVVNDVKVYDFYGNVVYKNSFDSNEFNIKGLKVRTGHYILNVQSSDGQILRKLIAVE